MTPFPGKVYVVVEPNEKPFARIFDDKGFHIHKTRRRHNAKAALEDAVKWLEKEGFSYVPTKASAD